MKKTQLKQLKNKKVTVRTPACFTVTNSKQRIFLVVDIVSQYEYSFKFKLKGITKRMSKSNPHRRIVLKMSFSSASKLLMYLSLAKKYAHIFEYDIPDYENGVIAFSDCVKTAVDNCDGVHQSVVDVRLNDIT